MMKAFTLTFLLLAGMALCAIAQNISSFNPGELWLDTDGKHINAHGGGILLHQGKYYWFGEHKVEGRQGNSAMVGVSCYSSADLLNWKNEGIALKVADENSGSEIEKGSIIERPKVIYNKRTKKFVMWFHLELKGKGYDAARTAVAVSDKVTGPYTYLKSFRPNAGEWPQNFKEEWKHKTVQEKDMKAWSQEWKDEVAKGLFIRRDFEKGQMSRDMTVFVDDDGKAYHIHSSEENLTLHLSELSPDYLSFTGKWITIEPAGHNEAPAIFKHKGKYYLITSGCTGWDPNAARSFVAESIWGPWKPLGNPAKGEGAELTFDSQSTYIIPAPGKKDTFIFMADRWRPKNPIDGRYVWLPITFEDDKPVFRWEKSWKLKDSF
ncbi:glycoside hydrolase family 43 protein [Pedobacter frigoris]|uniref:glycoside hydrolase family 43 protein n=1 Tax=Pedobacter frigoris TaxID=2571272 RepID=UPI0029312489|nr:glycoside hydrolase family 43 protein [Pedobacter frigoris]